MRPQIEWVVRGIREGFGGHLEIADFGRMARLSPCHMARLFHQETGLTPQSFLLAVRMEEARRKLLRSDTSIADIAEQVGYASLGAFTTRFTKTTGVPPGRYRRLTALGSGAVDLMAGSDSTHFTYGSIAGRIGRSDGLLDEPVYIAAFPVSANTRRTARCCCIPHSTGSWCIPHVPEGRWLVEAVSRTHRMSGHDVVVGQAGPFHIKPGSLLHVEVKLGASSALRAADPDRTELGLALPELLHA